MFRACSQLGFACVGIELVREHLDPACIVHVRETSKAQYLEHSLGRGCAMQLEKLGFHVEIEQECPNSGYNLELYYQ